MESLYRIHGIFNANTKFLRDFVSFIILNLNFLFDYNYL